MQKLAGPGRTVSPRELALVFLMLAPLAAVFVAFPPIPQDPAYHKLADDRAFLHVPNFLNVATNIAFPDRRLHGPRACASARGVDGAARSWTMFFFGTVLVAFGSAYYHWNPNNETLVWDRLPMTIAFMALFAALIAEHVRPDIERTRAARRDRGRHHQRRLVALHRRPAALRLGAVRAAARDRLHADRLPRALHAPQLPAVRASIFYALVESVRVRRLGDLFRDAPRDQRPQHQAPARGGGAVLRLPDAPKRSGSASADVIRRRRIQ